MIRLLHVNTTSIFSLFSLCFFMSVYLSVCVCVCVLLFISLSSSTGPPRWLSSDTAYTVISLRLDCVSKKVNGTISILLL